MMENVRVTAPDLARRAALDRTRSRLRVASWGFLALFGALAVRLAMVTVVAPHLPPPQRNVDVQPALVAPLVTADSGDGPTAPAPPAFTGRAPILDRNGRVLAVSQSAASVFANPIEMIDPVQITAQLKQVLPGLDAEATVRRLNAFATHERETGALKGLVQLARLLTPQEEAEINRRNIPGIHLMPGERRHYPLGNVAAQVLGAVDVNQIGRAGVERAFDDRLRTNGDPLRLSIDVRVQTILHDEVGTAMKEFDAIGAAGIVMDVNTGEVLGMVSLPDYDANDFGNASDDAKTNRAVAGMYEPGSTFKLQTAAMALDSGVVHIWDEFDALHPIRAGRFTITDFEGKHRFLYLPEVLAYSSNLGAARIAALVGAERQRAWLTTMGMLQRVGIELPEAGMPLAPRPGNWKELATMTIGFGHGIAVSPLHVVRGTATLANGGIFRAPTILAIPPDGAPAPGTRIMAQSTSDIIRRLMRLVVTDGYGKPAEVAGYFVGGKTGTAEKVNAGGGYKKHTNVSAFISVFPMNTPRYAVYVMLDEPHATAATHGYSTASYVAAPFAGHVISRIGPLLGVYPQTENVAAITAALSIPLEPGRPPGARPTPTQPGPGLPTPGQTLPGTPIPTGPMAIQRQPLAPVPTATYPQLPGEPMPPDRRHTELDSRFDVAGVATHADH